MRAPKIRRDETFKLEQDASRSVKQAITGRPGAFCDTCGHWRTQLEKIGTQKICKSCHGRQQELSNL